MFYCQGSFRKMLLCAMGLSIVSAAAPTSASGSDKIAVNAKSVFEKAGGTSKYGLSQKQLQAADAVIAAALDRLTRDGTLGGPVPPTVVFKLDLSTKEKITYPKFLEYFKGLASEQDLKVRRALVDRALAQEGAAQAAADAAMAEAQRAAADAEIARLNAQADRDRSGYNTEADRIRQKNIALQQFNAELTWYLQHPNQVVPHPETNASNRQAANGQNTAAANGTGNSPAKGTDATPVQPLTLGRPTAHRPPVVTTNPPNPLRTGGGGPTTGPKAASAGIPPGPKAAAPAGNPPPKDDKKPDDKSKK